MSTALRRGMTLEEFLAWEECQERRWEFDGVAPVAMVGVTRAHAEIQGNLTVALRTRLRGRPCRFYGLDLKVRTADSIRYPDGFVTCTAGARTQTVVDEPVVIFEILTPVTERIDHGEKAREYRTIPTLRRYVMLRQDRIAAEVHARDGAGDRWLSLLLFETDSLALPEIGVELSLAELYEGIELPPPDVRDDEGNPIGPAVPPPVAGR